MTALADTSVPLSPLDVWNHLMAGLDAWARGDDRSVTAAWAVLGDDRAIYAVSIAGMLDLAALALRLQLSNPDAPIYQLDELLARLSADGVLRPEDNSDALAELITYTAAVAGGIRPPVQRLLDAYWDSNLLELSGMVLTLALSSLSTSAGRTSSRVVRDIRGAARAHNLEPAATDTWDQRA